MMKRKHMSLATSLLLATSTLVACSQTTTPPMPNTLNPQSPVAQLTVLQDDMIDTQTLAFVSSDEITACGNWETIRQLPYYNIDDVHIHVCDADIGTPNHVTYFLYKGVVSRSLERLQKSAYYQSGGKDITGIQLTKKAAEQQNIAYQNNAYTIPLPHDPVARFTNTNASTYSEGTLATMDDIDAHEWTHDPNNPDILTTSTGEVLFMGAIFASSAALMASAYYKTKGKETNAIHVPATYTSGKANLAYNGGLYYSQTKPSSASPIATASASILEKSHIHGSTSGAMKHITGVERGNSVNLTKGTSQNTKAGTTTNSTTKSGKSGGTSSTSRGGGGSSGG